MKQDLLPNTPAVSRLREVANLVSNATPARIADYLREHYAPHYAEREPTGRRIASYMDWKARGGIEVVDVAQATERRVEITMRQPLSDEHWMVALEVERTPPHRIEALLVGRAALPLIHPPPSDAQAADAFIDYVGRLADADLFSGAVLIARHGEILGQAAFGLANRDFNVPNDLDTRFNIASLCKSWTAVAIAQLIEAGKLALDDPLSKFVDYPDRASASAIRIKHLLSHTSGLGTYFTDSFYRTARHLIRTVDDYLELSKDELPSFAPGTAWKYSNTGMVVLGKVIEIVTGRSYAEWVESTLLRPAGMTRSGFLELDYVNENVAVGYAKQWSVDGMRVANSLFENFVGGCPAGCAFATVGDVFRFVEALRSGRLVSHEMLELMTSAKPELQSPDYGYGFSIHPERALYGHSGGLLGVGANLDIVLDPAGWDVVVLANTLSMRAPTLKARQLIGVTVPEAESGRAYLPTAGMTVR